MTAPNMSDLFPYLLTAPTTWTDDEKTHAEFLYLRLCDQLGIEPAVFIAVGVAPERPRAVSYAADGSTILEMARLRTQQRDNLAATAVALSTDVLQAERQAEMEARRAAIPYNNGVG